MLVLYDSPISTVRNRTFVDWLRAREQTVEEYTIPRTSGAPVDLRQVIAKGRRAIAVFGHIGCPVITRRLRRVLGARFVPSICCRPYPRCSPFVARTLCIVTYAAETSALPSLRAIVAAMRLSREPLCVVGVRCGAAPDSDALHWVEDDSQPWDVHVDFENKGYDVLPFIRALSLVQDHVPFVLSPFVTKLHSKSCEHWRELLFPCALVSPSDESDAVVPRQCLAQFVPKSEDLNSVLWADLYKRAILPTPPCHCRFVAGTVFTVRRRALDECVATFAGRARHYFTSAQDMKQGHDGQIEHVLERYFGLLTITAPLARVSLV